MEYLEVVSRWIHVGTAIVLVGGSVFMRFILMPAAKDLPDDQHLALKGRIMGRWKRFVHTGIMLFMLSGAYNYYKAMPFHKGDKLYHPLIGTKIILAMIVFFIISALVGKSAKFESMRQNSKKWIAVAITLAAIIVGISGFARVRLKGTSQPDMDDRTSQPDMDDSPVGELILEEEPESEEN